MSSPTGEAGPWSRHDAVARVTAALGSAQEARWLVDHVEAAIPSAGGAPVDSRVRCDLLAALVARRQTGEPLQYVLGHWSFRSIELGLDRRVLIPRPETEQVVEVALRALGVSGSLRRVGLTEPSGQAPPTGASGTGASGTGRQGGTVVVDLGTGSGAIALSIAVEAGSELSDLTVWATDLSAGALGVARANREALVDAEGATWPGPIGEAPGPGRAAHPGALRGRDRERQRGGPFPPGAVRALHSLQFAHGSWFDPLPASLRGTVTLVVANPPYVSRTDYPRLDPGVREWEPELALAAGTGTGGVGGTAEIETVVRQAPTWLAPGGTLVVEIDPAQAYGAIDLARRMGFSAVRTERDLAGRNRMLVAVR